MSTLEERSVIGCLLMDNGQIRFILLNKIGKAVIDMSVTDEQILAAIDEINFTEEDAHE